MVEFLLSLLPIAVLLVCLLVISLPAKYSSAIAFAVAAVEFVFWFRPGALGMGITLSKGAVMALFVGLIALGAMLLYNLVDISGGFEVINGFLSRVGGCLSAGPFVGHNLRLHGFFYFRYRSGDRFTCKGYAHKHVPFRLCWNGMLRTGRLFYIRRF